MPLRLRVEDLRVLPNVVAGCNPLVIMSLAYKLRSSGWDCPPILVRREPDGWRVLDGRHRLIATIIAGRADLPAEEES